MLRPEVDTSIKSDGTTERCNRNLGKSGLQVSEIALGSWLTYDDATAGKAEACIDRAYELGVNFFDTANIYAGGAAERVVGKALAKH